MFRFRWVLSSLALMAVLASPAIAEPRSWGGIKATFATSSNLSQDDVLAVAGRKVNMNPQATEVQMVPWDGSFQISGLDINGQWFTTFVSSTGEFLGGVQVNLSNGRLDWIPGKEIDPNDPEFISLKDSWNSIKNFCRRVASRMSRRGGSISGKTKWMIVLELLNQLINEYCQQGPDHIEQSPAETESDFPIGNSPQDSTGGN